jgi:hypothetical protein
MTDTEILSNLKRLRTVQGLTLRPLMQWLALPEDGSVEEETRLARQATSRAAMQLLRSHGGSGAAEVLYREYAARAAGGVEMPSCDGTLSGLQGQAVNEMPARDWSQVRYHDLGLAEYGGPRRAARCRPGEDGIDPHILWVTLQAKLP